MEHTLAINLEAEEVEEQDLKPITAITTITKVAETTTTLHTMQVTIEFVVHMVIVITIVMEEQLKYQNAAVYY